MATIDQLPLTGRGNTGLLSIDGDPSPADTSAREVGIRTVTPNYFEVAGVPLLRGRAFTPDDSAGSPRVVLVNRALADRLFPGADPVGRRIAFEFFA